MAEAAHTRTRLLSTYTPCVRLPLTIVIPTYRPTSAVVELVRTVKDVAGQVLVSDDASPCTFDPIIREISSLAQIAVHSTNAGIARALNEGLRAAQDVGHQWLLTIDQDSQVDEEYVRALWGVAEQLGADCRDVGVIAPQHIRVSEQLVSYPEYLDPDRNLMTTHEVFQSGALWNVGALRSAGGFDETLGMDAVDAAACLRLRERGYTVVLAQDVALEHGWGDAQFISVGGRSIAITHHSAERRLTMVRNRLELAPAEFRQSPIHGLRTMRRLAVGTALALVREKGRRKKFGATVAGVRGAVKR